MTFLADGVKLKDAIALTNVLQQVSTTVWTLNTFHEDTFSFIEYA
jgi:hypothetical protein